MPSSSETHDDLLACSFAKLMFQGKTKAACLLTPLAQSGGIIAVPDLMDALIQPLDEG